MKWALVLIPPPPPFCVVGSVSIVLQQAGLGLAALATGAATGAAPANAAAGAAVEVMKLRFGDKLRRASKMLDELQMDISNDVRRSWGRSD